MTIASEITRLQNDKAAICTAIENKGVTVGNVTLDDYASCIDAIPTGGGGTPVEVLVVGAGGDGGYSGNSYACIGGGGGGGGVVICNNYNLTNSDVHIGQPNCGYNAGGDSWIGELTAKGGGIGGTGSCIDGAFTRGYRGGSGGGGGTGYNYGVCSTGGDIAGYLNLGSAGQQGNCNKGGGGGGAGGWGMEGCGRCLGGVGFFSDITGEYCEYGRGGDSGNAYGGRGYGGGGGGCCCRKYGTGCQGIVVVRYPTECGYSITGGCKYTCGDYTIHCFTNDDFIISEPINSQYCIGYLVVGGGGKGGGGKNGAGGGGGDVKFGVKGTSSTVNVVVGGESGTSCLGDEIIANGGESITCDDCCNGGTSGSGNAGGAGRDTYYGGGGGGALTRGANGDYSWRFCGGVGGYGIRGYGGGGGGAVGGYTGGYGNDGGGDGCYCSYYSMAKNCGGGGGGYCTYCCCDSCGACGVVDICYACDGSFGFTTATGGNCCYLCGKICVHRFTSNGTFTIVS